MNKRKAILAAALAGLISAGMNLQASTAMAAGNDSSSVEEAKPWQKKKRERKGKKARKGKKKGHAGKHSGDKNACGGKNGCGGHMHDSQTDDASSSSADSESL